LINIEVGLMNGYIISAAPGPVLRGANRALAPPPKSAISPKDLRSFGGAKLQKIKPLS